MALVIKSDLYYTYIKGCVYQILQCWQTCTGSRAPSNPSDPDFVSYLLLPTSYMYRKYNTFAVPLDARLWLCPHLK